MFVESGAKLKVRGKDGDIYLPEVKKTVIQAEIGEILPKPHCDVVLHELAYGHNIIDFIINFMYLDQ